MSKRIIKYCWFHDAINQIWQGELFDSEQDAKEAMNADFGVPFACQVAIKGGWAIKRIQINELWDT